MHFHDFRHLRAGGGGGGGVGNTNLQGSISNELFKDISNRGDGATYAISWFLLLGILYPFLYELVQVYQIGFSDYLTDLGNYVDLVYILGSILMTAVHIVTSPYEWYSKYLMSLIVFLAIRRTFNFLRIFKALSPIVTMLNNVIWELRIFMTFYAILCVLFSLWYGVLGLGNYRLRGKFRTDFNKNEGGEYELEPEMKEDAPGIEYK